MKNFIVKYKSGVKLLLYIRPGAGQDQIAGVFGDPERIKIQLKAPAVDGKANKALIAFLSKLFGISKSQIELLNGETSRQKSVYLPLDEKEVIKILDNNSLGILN